MPELVLYGIRLVAKQFLGAVLDMEVDHSDLVSPGSGVAVDGAESPPASGSSEVLRVASLQLSQTSHEDVSSLQGVLQQVVGLDRLQHGVQQHKLVDKSNED